jgi:transposase
MGRFIKITLDDKQRAALEDGYRHDKSHPFRQHCQLVLLKAEGRKSKEIAATLGCCEKSVNDWLHRYQTAGLEGLRIKAGRGRPSILSEALDAERVRQAVTAHRQRISLAKAELEANLGKEFSQRTLVRFLKNLTADTSV